MPKRLTSPVTRYPGDVVLSDPLNFEQAMAYEDGIIAVGALVSPTRTRVDATILPAVLACVSEWSLNGIPAHPTMETFPSTPRRDSAALIAWLVKEISELYQESQAVPPA